jgi:beta-phosphoglucomutase-like phosphatase (HAD superfamily)
LLDIKKEKCYIIEDSPKGKQAAYASGANVIEVDGVTDVNIKLLRDFI